MPQYHLYPHRALDIQTNIQDGKVNYIFYKKPMANPLLLRADSVMPLKMKRTAPKKPKR